MPLGHNGKGCCIAQADPNRQCAVGYLADRLTGRREDQRQQATVVEATISCVTTNPGNLHNSDGLAAALHDTGPADELASELETFGRFVGSWHIDCYGSASAEQPDAIGELHFGWVLGGRAVQDVWIVPGPGQPGVGVPPRAFHGSTLRFYDRQLGAWRSTWIEPINGRVRRFIGRPVGEEIELISLDGDPLLRWRFTEIRPDSFWWIGECSTYETRTWQVEERMYCTRTS